jgi:DNA-binding response OmpR family regulator
VGVVRPSVLVVTEDGALATACRGTLEQAGYDVTCASHSGHALLECLSGHRADVLLTELSMPDGSGPALAERLRRYHPQMQAVYLAAPGTMVDAGNVLVRPFSRDELLTRVRASVSR